VKAVEVFVENTIIQIKLSPKESSTTMKNDTKKPSSNVLSMPLGLEEMIRQGARQIISQALEAELAELLGQFSNVLTLDGKPAVVRNGYLPERPILTAVGPVPVRWTALECFSCLAARGQRLRRSWQ
jgi:hypothetical protein